MNWLDILLAFLLIASVAASFSKGFVREAVGLAAAILGLIGGAWFYRMAGEMLRPYTGSPEMANLCGFLIIFAGVILAGWLVSLLIGLVIKAVGLSWLDRLMGALFGAARGVVVCVAVITAIVAFAPGKEAPRAVVGSKVAPYMTGAAHVLTMAAPRELRDGFEVHYGAVKRLWQDALKRGLRRLPESEI